MVADYNMIYYVIIIDRLKYYNIHVVENYRWTQLLYYRHTLRIIDGLNYYNIHVVENYRQTQLL